ncbi:S9 family peptidase [Sediminibacterium soli]|uniref:S9 family peptidase n=1 Tax=Sediminibacterium soli TaxID=2698829 RepID=UPI001379B6D8|nr:S9 family peptidase [Sediminibacterium soli]NCI47171.1 prolyl oligopeptidase family serine peptidase [Sediminibacterium soli]
MPNYFRFGCLIVCAALSFTAGLAQTGRALTTAGYARAEKAMNYNTGQLADRLSIQPNWLSGDRFWYRVLTARGSEFIVVDPAKGTREPAFDQQKLAAALSAASGEKYEAAKLPFTAFSYAQDGTSVRFTAAGKNWKYDPSANTVMADNAATDGTGGGAGFGGRGGFGRGVGTTVASPDGKKTAFLRDNNLWVRDIASNKETQLTTDGVKNFAYATDNAGWKKSERPILVWSPDSKKIATYQQDERNVADMYLVTTNVGKPVLQSWKYPLAGAQEIVAIHRVIINVDKPEVIKLKLAPGARRGSSCDDISCGGKDFGDVEWAKDGSHIVFAVTSRDHKEETIYRAEANTGELRELFNEKIATQFESGDGIINWRYLSGSNEVLWYSERANWGHFYLYDASTGKLKNQVTRGDWAVTRLVKIDEASRTIYFLAGGREPGNPYFSHFYKIGFDGNNLLSLTPEPGNHQVTLAASGNYFIDRYSQQNVAPVTVLKDSNGKLVAALEKADISRLTATGWKPPVPFSVKAADGKTDIYGVMFTPSHLDPKKKYPIINYIYPGPQGGSVGNWGFDVAKGDCQALAELGFVVVAIEGTSNPLRSKSFHDMNYGNMAENTLPDQIGGMKQLAARYPYIDISKAGIWGHSGGGFATASAMFKYPDFFKVGISESGNHDNRNYEDDWGERYIGLETKDANGKSNYEAQANQTYAKNLKGKLMLAHGMLDDNVPPYNTLLVVEALEKANKDYDLVIFPNSRHGYGEYSLYMTRRRWDYFVKHLMGAEPPKEYELKTKTDPRNPVQPGFGAGQGPEE